MSGARFRGARSDSPRPLPAAVLFDLDGTLIDSEPLWCEAERLLVADYGQEWTGEQARHLVGWSLRDSARYLREQIGIELADEVIIDRMQSFVVADLSRDIPWRPGALDLLAEVHRSSVPAGLVTMSHRHLTNAVVAALPAGTFQAVVTGEQVSRGKPHPDPYLLGAERLGVPAEDCVAIEDSLTGATSARDAGCAVLLVTDDPGRVALFGVARRTNLVGMRLSGLSDLLWARTAA